MDKNPSSLFRRPFRPVPDPGIFYPSNSYQQAVDGIVNSSTNGDTLIWIDGSPGLGKTLIGHVAILELRDECLPIFVQLAKGMKPEALLQSILFDLQKSYRGLNEHEARLAVHGHLLDLIHANHSLVMIVDEAHNLSPALADELMFLSNLNSHMNRGTVTIVILALPSFRESLLLPEFQQFNDRISKSFTIASLTYHESIDFVRYQLRASGASDGMISGEALEIIARAGNGVPRQINRIALLAMHLATSAGLSEVDAEPVIDALGYLGIESEFQSEPEGNLTESETEDSVEDIIPHPNATRWNALESVNRRLRI